MFYLRVCTYEEDKFVLQKIQDIAKDHADAKKQPLLTHLRGLLNGLALPGGNCAVENKMTDIFKNTSAKCKSPDLQLDPLAVDEEKKKIEEKKKKTPATKGGKEELVANINKILAKTEKTLADKKNEELNPQPNITMAPGKRIKLRLSAPDLRVAIGLGVQWAA